MRQLFFLLASIFLLSCAAGDKLQDHHIYWVNSSKVSCVGLAPTQCLQVQKSESLDPAAWKTFHASISGFEYESGYIYKLIVKEQHLDPAELPADASSIEYSLVKILEKNQDLRWGINGTWKANKIKDNTLLSGVDNNSLPQLEIHVGEMRYSGSDGCNNFHGGIIELDKHTIRFGITAGTRMMCMDMTIPDLFNTSLPEIRTWEIRQNMLHLFDADGQEVMQLISF